MASIFTFVFSVAVALFPAANAQANNGGHASGGFQNALVTACWLFGLIYIAIGCIWAFKAWKFRKKSPDEKTPKTGAIYLLLSGSLIFAFPFIQSAMQGSISGLTIDQPQSLPRALLYIPGVRWIVWGLFLAAPFFPWVMLLCLKSLRAYRRQGDIGLILLATPLILALTFMALRKGLPDEIGVFFNFFGASYLIAAGIMFFRHRKERERFSPVVAALWFFGGLLIFYQPILFIDQPEYRIPKIEYPLLIIFADLIPMAMAPWLIMCFARLKPFRRAAFSILLRVMGASVILFAVLYQLNCHYYLVSCWKWHV